MSYLKYYSLFPVLFLILGISFSITSTSQAQIIRATGNATEASSQLIFFYDELAEGDTGIQVTNTNDTQGVWVHVQIFRSYDAGDSTVVPVLCDERDFVDFYTPNDTHIYTLDIDNFDKNIGSDEVTPGESSSIVDTDETKGFVVVTPVVSESDFSAISFQWMIGNSLDEGGEYVLNAMGRDAVDFTTGEVLADGTPLDGISNGFVLLQPGELIFNFAQEDSYEVDVVEFAWADVYGPPGLLGYAVQPSTATLQPFIFDFKEDVTSCGLRVVDCFLTLGLNDNIPQNNEDLTEEEDLLCAGTETPQYADGNGNFNQIFSYFGWTRIFVSGLESNANLIGLIFFEDFGDGAYWLNTNN